MSRNLLPSSKLQRTSSSNLVPVTLHARMYENIEIK